MVAMKVARLLVVLLALVALSCGGERTEAERVRALESRIWSPYCPGRLLADCTTRQATELRVEIADRVASGDSDAEVTGWLRSNFGDEVLAAPAPGPRGLAIWLIPGAALLAGAVLVAGAVRRWSRPGASDEPAPPVTAVPDEEREMWVQRVRHQVHGDHDVD
jgi:cytochrome c-type biogenesis protein CcmH